MARVAQRQHFEVYQYKLKVFLASTPAGKLEFRTTNYKNAEDYYRDLQTHELPPLVKVLASAYGMPKAVEGFMVWLRKKYGDQPSHHDVKDIYRCIKSMQTKWDDESEKYFERQKYAKDLGDVSEGSDSQVSSGVDGSEADGSFFSGVSASSYSAL